MSSSRASTSSAATSSPIGARTRPCSRGCVGEAVAQAASDEKSRSGLRHCRMRTGIEGVVFQRLDGFGVEGRAAAGRAEGAVAHVAAGAAGDLAEFRRVELAEAEAVEFLVRGEGHVVHVEVEPHADGVGGDQVIDVARSGRARPGRCGCGAKARRAPPPRRRSGGGSARRWRRPPRPRRRRWRCGGAGATPSSRPRR